jgi:hypothetical protein
MRPLTLCLVLALPLALCPQAAAKEVVSVKVCGISECERLTDRQALLAFQEGGPPTNPPSKASAFYRAELRVRGEGDDVFRFSIAVVPDAGLLRGEDGTWMPVSNQAVAQFRRVTRGLEPFPAARLGGLDSGRVEARVDEVVMPPEDVSRPAPGNAPVWPWILGGLALLTLSGYLLAAAAGRRLARLDPPGA